MATQLLTTKLYIPPIRSKMVSRPRLMKRLMSGLHRKLTLVSAPAGFGKTTLLGECAASCGQPIAWISLDTGDNDPVRFWSYLIGALQTIPSLREASLGEAFLAMLHSSGIAGTTPAPPIEGLLTGMINELAEVDERFVLVLDDFHLITEPKIHDGLVFLIDHAPPPPQGIHLILSSRADPPWPLARLRARAEMTMLRVGELRFTVEEVNSFLNDVMGFELPAGAIAALDARTEGWIAGLQMAAISMRERRRAHHARTVPAADTGLTAFVEALSGSHRFILDYLVEEVLDLQNPTIQEFLLKTSILERMTASLCDAITERDDSQTILAQLDSANLFLNPLDDERRWYRYHRLFADLLHSRLQQTLPDRIPALHSRASEWYEQAGVIAAAMGHALAAGDVERAARLVEGNAMATIYHGQLATVEGWFDALPDKVVRSRPWLCVSQAWLLGSSGQWDGVESLLQDAERGAHLGSTEGTTDTQHLIGYITAVRTYASAIQADLPLTQELARKTLQLVPRDDSTVRNFAATLLGSALRHSGDLEAADRVWTEAVAAGRAAGDRHSAVILLSALASLQIEQGQLHRAAATCQDVLQLADESIRWGGRRLPAVAPAYARLSTLFREWNDVQEAVRQARECLRLCEPWGHAEAMTTGWSTLAHALQVIGDKEGAGEAMEKARQIAGDLSPWYRARIDAEQACLWLAQGKLEMAGRWLQGTSLDLESEISFDRMPDYVTMARVMLARDQSSQASELLTRLRRRLESSGAKGSAIEVLVLQALALQAQGDKAEALAALERALSLAEPEGYVRTFIGEGKGMADLLKVAAARGATASYASKLLAQLESESDTKPDATVRRGKAGPAPQPLIDPLSERELEVLRLLLTSLTASEIGDELYISSHTVRSHIKNIYSKLDVHSRIEAVARAQELELL
jgi:LuxR family maltose regulon positive regulatory protein